MERSARINILMNFKIIILAMLLTASSFGSQAIKLEKTQDAKFNESIENGAIKKLISSMGDMTDDQSRTNWKKLEKTEKEFIKQVTVYANKGSKDAICSLSDWYGPQASNDRWHENAFKAMEWQYTSYLSGIECGYQDNGRMGFNPYLEEMSEEVIEKMPGIVAAYWQVKWDADKDKRLHSDKTFKELMELIERHGHGTLPTRSKAASDPAFIGTVLDPGHIPSNTLPEKPQTVRTAPADKKIKPEMVKKKLSNSTVICNPNEVIATSEEKDLFATLSPEFKNAQTNFWKAYAEKAEKSTESDRLKLWDVIVGMNKLNEEHAFANSKKCSLEYINILTEKTIESTGVIKKWTPSICADLSSCTQFAVDFLNSLKE